MVKQTIVNPVRERVARHPVKVTKKKVAKKKVTKRK